MNELIEDKLVPHPGKPLVYSSRHIQERRRRILKEARRMIAENGLENFSIRTLCKNADVAQRTLYNAFQNKERIIAMAIREAYEDVNKYMKYRTSATTLEGIVDRLIFVNTRNLRAANYTRAVTAIYFSPAAKRDVWNVLRDMVFLNLRQWLKAAAKRGGLHDWVDTEEVAADIANLEYATIHDWALGRLSDEQYVKRLVLTVLSLIAGVTRGEEHERAIAMLRRIRRTGQLPEFPKPVFVPPTAAEEEEVAA